MSGPFNYDTEEHDQRPDDAGEERQGPVRRQDRASARSSCTTVRPPTSPRSVMNKDVDYATHGFAVASEKTFQQNGFRILRPPVYSGPALVFNYTTHPEFSDVRVRQAIAYDHRPQRERHRRARRLGQGLQVHGRLLRHPRPGLDLRRRPEEAAGLREGRRTRPPSCCRRRAGRSPATSGQTPTGKPAAYDIKFPTEFADWNPAATNAADQLNKFGFNITKRGITFTQLNPDVLAGKFDIAIQGWGAVEPPAPVLRVRPGPRTRSTT